MRPDVFDYVARWMYSQDPGGEIRKNIPQYDSEFIQSTYVMADYLQMAALKSEIIAEMTKFWKNILRDSEDPDAIEVSGSPFMIFSYFCAYSENSLSEWSQLKDCARVVRKFCCPDPRSLIIRIIDSEYKPDPKFALGILLEVYKELFENLCPNCQAESEDCIGDDTICARCG
ncbi:hypothetical protein H072_499 [Dactylellina haptotyla CBS 200.50]|uniref:BTB domain-containing protein n=1 Tax=Dactylellina haptotyla (strain CBS 200.50) TaxID=1284197 RepID=S8AR75_DACHA|nr:hypothetical protein H072_499 [Dactylellina haptotyla CBS 200.50]